MPATKILWIVTTQWRAQATGFAGDVNARTPSLDRLAAASVNYSQAVTPHPMGPLARAALFTGVPCPANGVRDYFDPLPAGVQTVAHALGARGFRTAFFGKWHLGVRDPAAPLVGESHAKTIVPAERRGGFEFWEGFESGFLLNDPWLHGTRLPEPRRFAGYQSDVLVDRFASWRASQKDGEAFFAVVSLEAPHPPYDAPAAGIRPHDPAALVLAPNVAADPAVRSKARRELAGYYAHLEATDRAIGRLLATVDESWTVVFTSVHGDMHGAHGLFRKGWPYEESVRVPLLVRRPGVVPGEDPSAVSLTDLAGLTVAWADGSEPPPTPAAAKISMPSVVALPQQCDRIWRGVRTRTRKLILDGEGESWLFFDLARDPLEQSNLATNPAEAAEINELRQLI